MGLASQSHMVRAVVFCLVLASAVAVPVFEAQAPLDDTTLYTLEYVAKSGDCAQVTVPTADVKGVEAMDETLKVGTCASIGYTVADGSIAKKVPVLGTLKILKQPQTGYYSFTGLVVQVQPD